MKKIKLFKVLNKDMTTPFQKFQMEIDKEYHCDDFDDDIKKFCSYGFHATDIEGLIYCFNTNRRVFMSEVWGKKVEINLFKRRYENIKLIREMSFDEIRKLAKEKEKHLGYKLSEVLFPYNPLIKKGIVTDKEIKLLNKWISVKASVGDSIRASVWDSVRNSVKACVWDSIWDSIWRSAWDSVRASVRTSIGNSALESIEDSVCAYLSSLFLNIKKWAYIEHIEGENPYQPCIDLWKSNLVPSFDGKIWRLHTGPKAEIVYESK